MDLKEGIHQLDRWPVQRYSETEKEKTLLSPSVYH